MLQTLFTVKGLRGLNEAQIAKAELVTADFQRRFEVTYIVDRSFDLKSLFLTEGNIERRRAMFDTESASYTIFSSDLDELCSFDLKGLHIRDVRLSTDVYANNGLAIRFSYGVTTIV
jgi:hypothetical protein